MSRLDFADLTDTEFNFTCDFALDGSGYWDYDFCAEIRDEKHFRSMSRCEVQHLKDNCKRILQAIEHLQGGN